MHFPILARELGVFRSGKPESAFLVFKKMGFFFNDPRLASFFCRGILWFGVARSNYETSEYIYYFL